MKIPSFLVLSGLLLTGSISVAHAAEQDNLALLLSQLRLLDATLQRAEKQAIVATDLRFYFDYPQAHADIQAMRNGIEHYLTPSRAQPRQVLPLAGTYRQERKP